MKLTKPHTVKAATSRFTEQPNRQTVDAPELLREPKLVDKINDAISATGYAGSTRAPLLAFVALTSRFFARPLNLAFIAPAATGKNRAIDSATRLIPPEAYVAMKASSPRAWIHSKEPLAHRFIIMNEADSIPVDGAAASAVRSIVNDAEFSYEVVEPGASGQNETRRIHKEGPVGLLTTATRHLDPQLGSRVLQINLIDHPSDTRAIMLSHASRFDGTGPQALNTDPFWDMHRWLETKGTRQVQIPFGKALMQLLPDTQTRFRRDSYQLLTAIATMAFLHQLQRERNEHGQVIATLFDYSVIRELLAPSFDSIVQDGVTQEVRETVLAIEDGAQATLTELSNKLRLAKSTVSERVHKGIQGGWILNAQLRRGAPMMLRRGLPLPESTHALPTTFTLLERWDGSPEAE